MEAIGGRLFGGPSLFLLTNRVSGLACSVPPVWKHSGLLEQPCNSPVGEIWH